MVRFTFDMPMSMHKNIKIACVEDGVSMNSFMIKAIENLYSERAEKSDESDFLEGMKDVDLGNTKPWDEVKKAIGL
jgi:hypothetical protein